MKIKAIRDFYDLEMKKTVKAGDEYEVSEKRANELAGDNNRAKQPLVEIIKAPTTTPKKVVKAAPKKKTEEDK